MNKVFAAITAFYHRCVKAIIIDHVREYERLVQLHSELSQSLTALEAAVAATKRESPNVQGPKPMLLQ